MGRKAHIRKIRTLLGFSILFIILGVGNMAIGYSRGSEYDELLIEANRVVQPNPTLLEGAGLPPPTENLANKESHLRRLTARRDFYRFVMAGGKVFLGVAGFLLLFILVLSRDTQPRPPLNVA